MGPSWIISYLGWVISVSSRRSILAKLTTLKWQQHVVTLYRAASRQITYERSCILRSTVGYDAPQLSIVPLFAEEVASPTSA